MRKFLKIVIYGVKLEAAKLQVLNNFDKIIIALPYLINVIIDISTIIAYIYIYIYAYIYTYIYMLYFGFLSHRTVNEEMKKGDHPDSCLVHSLANKHSDFYLQLCV